MPDENETFMGHLGQSTTELSYGTFMGHMRHVSFLSKLDGLEAEAAETNAALRAVLKKLGI